MLLTLALYLSAAAAGAEPSREPWATVSKDPARVREKTVLSFGTLGVARNRPFELAYYAKRTVRRREEAAHVQWADSSSCPGLKAALAGLADLSPPRIDVPGFPPAKGGTDEGVVIDGVIYTLKLDRLSFSTNIGSGLAQWTEKTLRALEPCWRDQAPADVNPSDAT